MMKKKKKMNANRAKLIEMSKAIKSGMKAGLIDAATVNEALIDTYKSEGATELATMTGWNEKGLKLKKGCKAKWVWGRPREDMIKKSNEKGETEEEKLKWYPMAKLFDISDTEPMSDKMAEHVEKKLKKYGKKMRRLKLEKEVT